ncbi:MAG: hypothetical protein RE471_04295 [Ferroplasma sp.]|uniref:hypothetical protein n=1 Tax=Ferroplasma sp. TaxID=2591003 RepID=UPI0028149C30|nr:hypothetical protein [Ferroplasma sp.]WMT52101.1 MAG: hypothetical protein RE471_04295 [Ferroplasma sp.]
MENSTLYDIGLHNIKASNTSIYYSTMSNVMLNHTVITDAHIHSGFINNSRLINVGLGSKVSLGTNVTIIPSITTPHITPHNIAPSPLPVNIPPNSSIPKYNSTSVFTNPVPSPTDPLGGNWNNNNGNIHSRNLTNFSGPHNIGPN